MRREGWKGVREGKRGKLKGRRGERIGERKLRKEGRKGINQEIKMVGCEEGWKEEITKGKEKGIGEPNFSFEGEYIENKKALLFVTV